MDTTEQVRAYYDALTPELRRVEDQNPHLIQRLRVLELAFEDFATTQGRTVLDIGCGNGRLALMLYERGLNVTGADISTESLRIARSRFTGSAAPVPQFVECDAAQVDSLGRFDLLTCTEMLEHVPDARAVLLAARRAVREQGYLFVTVPNRLNAHGLRKFTLTKLLGRPWPVPKDDWFTFWSMRRLARQTGWKVVWRSGAYFLPPAPLQRYYEALLRRRWARPALLWAERTLPWVWGLYLVVVLKPVGPVD